MENDHKVRALEKLRAELAKDIDIAKELASECGLMELLWFVYMLHLTRLVPRSDKLLGVANIYTSTTEDSIKYLIPLIAKYGHGGIPIESEDPPLQLELVQYLLKLANLINSKYYMEGLLELTDVQVFGERDQHFRIDMTRLQNDPVVSTLAAHSSRILSDNEAKRSGRIDINTLLSKFATEFDCVSDLFEREMHATITDYCKLIYYLAMSVQNRMQSIEPQLEILPDGTVAVLNQISFLRCPFASFSITKELWKISQRALEGYLIA